MCGGGGVVGDRLIARPMDALPAVERALRDYVGSVHADHLKAAERARREFRVGFDGSFGAHALTPRSLSAAFLGMLVSVEGVVTRCTCARRARYGTAHISSTHSTGAYVCMCVYALPMRLCLWWGVWQARW
jgi:DNA replication licensing factor MCM3